MKTRSFAFLSAAVLLLSVVGFAVDATVKKRQGNALVGLLPSSDCVATLDARRFFGTALPQILSSNPSLLTSITDQIADIESKTGIDLRKFDSVAIGLAMKNVKGNEYDFDPVAIARGDFKAGALVAIAKLASNGTYREEKIGDHTVYVFTPKNVAQKAAVKAANSKIGDMITKGLDGLTHEVAVTSLDANTLAFGSLPRVRETIEAKTHVSADLTSLLAPKETSIMDFAIRTPAGMSRLLPLENDELGANIDSIRFVSGSLDSASAGTSLQVIAKTVKAEQAQSLYETLDGLKLLGKAFLGGSKRPDQKVYARMIENAKISVKGNSVMIDLLVPQTDIDALIGAVK